MTDKLISYETLLSDLKTRIRTARTMAALTVNRELVMLYWHIGREIMTRQAAEKWGAKIIERLAADLRREFPEMRGFSPRNLKYMRALVEAWPEEEFVQQVVAQLPWGHNVRILDYLKSPDDREWYLRKAIEHGWSRNILVHQIESGLILRQAKAVTNFQATLTPPQSDLAHETLKDPYILDFLSIGEEAHERELEHELVRHITNFLLELGAGFSYVGKQYHLEVGREDFYLDLLFYHLKLRCYIVIELKAGPFRPEYAGKLNFYLSAVDAQLKHESDNPSIGLILCKDKNKLVAEYALKDIAKPVGISEYRLVEAIPEELKTSLPTIEQLEAELTGEE